MRTAIVDNGAVYARIGLDLKRRIVTIADAADLTISETVALLLDRATRASAETALTAATPEERLTRVIGAAR